MATLNTAHNELFRRGPDEVFATYEELYAHCNQQRQQSTELWKRPGEFSLSHDLTILKGDDGGELSMVDWSFSQLCRMASVSKDTINRLSRKTASRALEETLPSSGKPLQFLKTGEMVATIVNRSDKRTQKYVRYEYRVVMIDPKTAKRTQTISVEALPALRDDHADKLLFNGDGSKLGILIKGENIFALWDDKEKRLVTISDETQPDWPYPSDFAFSKSGKTLVLSAKRRCHLYDAQTGMRTGVVKGDFGAALTVLSKSEVLSGFSIWNANPLKLLVQGPDTIPDCFVGNGQCAFSARYLRTRIQRWDLQTLELSELRTESPVASLGLSKDGSLLAAGCRDGIIRVWDANNHRLLVNLKGHQGSVESLDFYPKASILASASRDGNLP